MTTVFDRQRAGQAAIGVVEGLFDTWRSITGDGNRQAIRELRNFVPELNAVEVPSGSQAFDWSIPPEWRLRGARLEGPDGEVIVDVDHSPLHVVGYSEGVDSVMELEDLQPHLHSLPERPHAIPYRTSYYERTWGFCLPHSTRESLPEGRYRAVIDAEHDDQGSLTYGEAILGEGELQLLLTAHMCHPAQANDNLSGMAVLAAVTEQLRGGTPGMTLRSLFLPGGIGSLAWLSRNEALVPNIVGGLSLACLGDPAGLSFKATRSGGTVIDRTAEMVGRDMGLDLGRRPFEPYGFDERNFSSPGIATPFGSLTRSPHGEYPEYHSSDDSIELMDADRLGEAAEFVFRCVVTIGSNRRLLRYEPRGEPQLGKRGLYGSVGGIRSRPSFESALLWVANLSDGEHDLIDIALRSGIPFSDVVAAADALSDTGVTYDAGHASSQSTSG